MEKLLWVGFGGAIGAICRYLISTIPIKTTLPVLTLFTNFIGAILIGIIVGVTSNMEVSPKRVIFWKTGLCGGLTTFSTFSLETLQLFENGRVLCGGLYTLSSVLLCLIGVLIGKYTARKYLKI